ncbi:TERF1-interacting nuclear factor 2 isoform X2 [Centropristis striata]|uniref:TERF1-interacting nuclear factor 2 isoform X2 n=1 Tax=Centropristis striata TaxID=184440 RepID=UPI0027E143CE|nr:TERF1-interacting nuclear factor 2 isoform X2 [Centropristis striata]
MATRKPQESAGSLPFAALQLLSPPVRLVSAALWKVMKQRDVMQYGVVEEFVSSACDTVPGLLTTRHLGKLALGLRGRLVLELCRTPTDENVIMTHLERIRAPAALSASSAPTMKRDVKIIRTVEAFRTLVHTLLRDSEQREQFFKEEFLSDYGPKFDQELEKLLWEFLIRIDQLLPVPNLAQTVSWLSGAPPVLEECARAATQPQLLKILLQHQTCLGHLETAASLPPNMGDSILTSLSLPPSGRVPSNQPTGAKESAASQPNGSHTSRDKTPFITPVIGLISNKDVPLMNRTQRGDEQKEDLRFTLVKQRQKPKEGEEEEEEEEETNTLKRSSRMKRKQPDEGGSESEEEELGMIRSGKKRVSKSAALRRDKGQLQTDESEEEDEEEESNLKTCMTKLGVKTLNLPKDPSLCSIFVSCLSRQPAVIVDKLSVTPASDNRSVRGGKSLNMKRESQRRKSPAKPPNPDLDFPGLDDKEDPSRNQRGLRRRF